MRHAFASVCAIGLWLGAVPSSPAAAASTVAAERKQIHDERKAVEAGFRAGEKDCAKRFAVTACVNELQTQRREALARLHERELLIDESERRREAEENARRLKQKQDKAQATPPPKAKPPPAPRASASAPAKSQHTARPSKTADDPEDAAARVAARERRIAEAEARREAAEKRQAERAASGKKTSPLPTPAPLPPASAASG